MSKLRALTHALDAEAATALSFATAGIIGMFTSWWWPAYTVPILTGGMLSILLAFVLHDIHDRTKRTAAGTRQHPSQTQGTAPDHPTGTLSTCPPPAPHVNETPNCEPC